MKILLYVGAFISMHWILSAILAQNLKDPKYHPLYLR